MYSLKELSASSRKDFQRHFYFYAVPLTPSQSLKLHETLRWGDRAR